MAKRYFTDESLQALISNTRTYTDSAVSVKADLDHTHPEATQSTSGLMSSEDKLKLDTEIYTKADHDWNLIYDSGEITEKVNAFANINISGYKKLRVVVKCVNDGTNTTSKNGAATFKSANGITYQFPCWTTMFTNAAYTSGAMATFEINDNWLICSNATRMLKTSNFLGSEGGTADNLNNTGSGIMKCTNPLSTLMVSAIDQDANYYYLAGSRVIVWGCNA